METIMLTVEARQGVGKGAAGRLRRGGKVPGVFYSPGRQAAPFSMDAREFRVKLAGLEGSHLVQLTSPFQELHGKIVILKEVQRHPVTSELLHVDFYEVDVTKPIQVTVPLHFVGKAEGVTAGGSMQTMFREILVECLPREIPEFVQVDVSGLKVHDTIHLADLTLPAGVRALNDANDTLVTVLPPIVVVEEVKPVEEGAPAEAPAEAPVEAEKQ